MKVTTNLIGERIRKLLEKRNEELLDEGRPPMRLKELAEKSGVGLSTIKNAVSENQTNRTITKLDDVIRIAHALDVSPLYLLTEVEDENYTVCDELGLSNETVNRLKTMNNALVKWVIDVLVADWSILMHLNEYLKSDYEMVQRNTTFEFFPVTELSGFDRKDLERVNRLRLLDDLQRIREENKGGKAK
jgi:transcriptional regulator with XRE-family HTH domain